MNNVFRIRWGWYLRRVHMLSQMHGARWLSCGCSFSYLFPVDAATDRFAPQQVPAMLRNRIPQPRQRPSPSPRAFSPGPVSPSLDLVRVGLIKYRVWVGLKLG